MRHQCVIRIIRRSQTEKDFHVDIFHYMDGYPEGVGFDILEMIESHFRKKPHNEGIDSESLMSILLHGSDKGYVPTLWIRGGLGFYYEIQFPANDMLSKEDSKKALRCWALKCPPIFGETWNDYDDIKEREIDVLGMYEQYQKEQKCRQ